MLTAVIVGFIVLAILVNYLRVPYSNTSGQWSYRDPKGKFTVDYPSGWKEEKPDSDTAYIKFDSRVWGFNTDPKYSIVIGMGPSHEWVGRSLNEYYNSFITNMNNIDPNFRVIKPVDYTTFKIVRHDAASWTYRQSRDARIVDTITVVSLLNGTSVYGELVSNPDSLAMVVPLLNHTIASINLTRGV